jgi:hypothetical protein
VGLDLMLPHVDGRKLHAVCAHRATRPSLCSRRGAKSQIASPAWRREPTVTWSSRSARRNR